MITIKSSYVETYGLVQTKNDRPLFSFSEKKNEHDYPMVEYLSSDSYGNLIEMSERNHLEQPLSSEDLSSVLPTPIAMINGTTTPEEFFQLCRNEYPHFKLTHADRNRMTALAMAVSTSNLDLVKALIDAVPTVVCSKSKKTARKLFVNQRLLAGATALHFIGLLPIETPGRISILELLIHEGADLELSKCGFFEYLDRNLDSITFGYCKYQYTLLLRAIDAKDVELTEVLIMKGAKVPKCYYRELFAIEMFGIRQIELIQRERLNPNPPRPRNCRKFYKVLNTMTFKGHFGIYPARWATFFYDIFKGINDKFKGINDKPFYDHFQQMKEQSIVEKYTIIRLGKNNPNNEYHFMTDEFIFNYFDILNVISTLFIRLYSLEKGWVSYRALQSQKYGQTIPTLDWGSSLGRYSKSVTPWPTLRKDVNS